MQVGIKKTVRIGGQSQSRMLQQHNLREISQQEPKTGSENYLLHKLYERLDESSSRIEVTLGHIDVITKHANWSNLEYHLKHTHPLIHKQFQKIDEDGWEIAGRSPFDVWNDAALRSSSTKLTAIQVHNLLEKAEINVNSLSGQERRDVVSLWRNDIHEIAMDDIYEHLKETRRCQTQIADIHDEVDRRVLQGAGVIGITTTGLSKRISTLQRLRCKVVICEEAGEVP